MQVDASAVFQDPSHFHKPGGHIYQVGHHAVAEWTKLDCFQDAEYRAGYLPLIRECQRTSISCQAPRYP